MKKVRISTAETDNFRDDGEEEDLGLDGEEAYRQLNASQRMEARAAEHLSVQLLAVDDDDEDAHDEILRKSLRFFDDDRRGQAGGGAGEMFGLIASEEQFAPSSRSSGAGTFEDVPYTPANKNVVEEQARRRLCSMFYLTLLGAVLVIVALYAGMKFVGPPNQPVGPYQLIERQEGETFFDYYNFYEGRDSAGSNGYNTYVSATTAKNINIFNVSMEDDVLDVYNVGRTKEEVTNNYNGTDQLLKVETDLSSNSTKQEPFVYMSSASTSAGPRQSIRLEGIRRFNRGLFIIDVRHMPAGCGLWPAFWLVDEANWPINGEIDILEGVNYQTKAKTALHATRGCSMDDIPLGTMTGSWDTAQGIPDKKTGIPDMTLRYAQNCFVYDPRQWLNQGCVAVDEKDGTIGVPLNEKGGGVYALEWDPIFRHIRSWVFTPHESVPDNLVDTIRTASFPEDKRVQPDPDQWPTPYGYFAIGEGTNCAASHFKHMRIVFNTAFCGSVAGNRFQKDCPEQAKKYETCNDWIMSDPDELREAYWKIRGVYVYERRWERSWMA